MEDHRGSGAVLSLADVTLMCNKWLKYLGHTTRLRHELICRVPNITEVNIIIRRWQLVYQEELREMWRCENITTSCQDTSRVVLSEAVDWCICFTRKIQHGGDWERSRHQGQKNVHNFLMTVRPLSWACGHETEMLLILKNLWLKPVSATGATKILRQGALDERQMFKESFTIQNHIQFLLKSFLHMLLDGQGIGLVPPPKASSKIVLSLLNDPA